MDSLRDVGNVMGEYAGDGQGDVQATVSVGMESGDADAGVPSRFGRGSQH